MINLRKAFLSLLAAAVLLLPAGRAAKAQAIYTGHGPGTYSSIGISGSLFQADYGQRKVAGVGLFMDGNLYRRVGLEGSVRTLNLRTSEGVRQTTYLVGPKISARGRTARPYVRLLVGRAYMTFPFNLAQGNYFVIAPGAGLDWRIQKSRFLLRVVDVEYQIWPQFSFGQLHPYGISSGISYTFFRPTPRMGHY